MLRNLFQQDGQIGSTGRLLLFQVGVFACTVFLDDIQDMLSLRRIPFVIVLHQDFAVLGDDIDDIPVPETRGYC